jgi:hypothetical protein
VLEVACEAVLRLLKLPGGGVGQEIELLVPILELWDGICGCWQGKPKPAAWSSLIFKTAKGFPPDARERAAGAAQVIT